MIKEPLLVPMLWVLIFKYNCIKGYSIKYNLQNALRYNWSGQHGEEARGFQQGFSHDITTVACGPHARGLGLNSQHKFWQKYLIRKKLLEFYFLLVLGKH